MHSPLIGRRRRALAGFAAVLVLVAGASWWVSRATVTTGSVSRSQAHPPAALLTTTVVSRMLSVRFGVTGTVVTSGSESAAIGQMQVPNAVSIVTARTVAPGDLVANGTVIAQVAGRPVIALAGTVPMYRMLTDKDSGADVAQLQHDLEALGYSISDVAGVYGPSTSNALADLYRHLGYAPPPEARGGKNVAAVIDVPQAEIVFIPVLPATASAVSERIDHPAGNPALKLTYGPATIAVQLSAAQAYEIEPGAQAWITLTTGRHLRGHVSSLKRSLTSANASAAVTANGLAEAEIGQQVKVTIIVRQTHRKTLAVPVSALYATGAGTPYVIVLNVGHRTRIPVSLGVSSGGYQGIRAVSGVVRPGQTVLLNTAQ
jgi:hypothetical protein